MDLSLALDLSREALLTALIISGPVLVAGLVVGLVISIVQVVTQIQDQTISIVPKIVAMVAAGVFFIPWLTQRIVEYTRTVFAGP
jgi:flagellar biosynthetic protein FliQ